MNSINPKTPNILLEILAKTSGNISPSSSNILYFLFSLYFKYKIKVIKNPKIRILFPTKIGLTNKFKVILSKLFNVLKMKLSKIYDIGIIDNNLKNIKFFL